LRFADGFGILQFGQRDQFFICFNLVIPSNILFYETIPFILSILIASSAVCQTNKTDTVTFCYIKYLVPAGCEAKPNSSVQCDGWKLSWIYLSVEMLQTVPDQLINQMAGQLQKFKKESISCYLLGSPAKGYRLSYQMEGVKVYQLIAYGIANEQPVILQLSLNKSPQSDEDIPVFARQMIKLSR
jgi:hypothetical protein